MYTNKVPISGWRRRSVITKLIIIKLINKYKINLNSKEIYQDEKKLKLTEKEIQTIIYLSNSAKPITTDELQSKVWHYQKDLETHTVETHIYRLRKKFLNFFNDNDFIISEKNGYKNQIRKTLLFKIYLLRNLSQK